MAFASPSTPRGQGGSELWIAKRFLQDRSLVFVLFSDHRRLLLKAYTSIGIVTLFAAHALDTSAYSELQVRDWWHTTIKMFKDCQTLAFRLS